MLEKGFDVLRVKPDAGRPGIVPNPHLVGESKKLLLANLQTHGKARQGNQARQ
jgi:hypothetical protein